ncbi:MAG: type II toxin-antitoxin system RelE/ParE family toxin [Halieaceae bacterium]|jgi:plasmid stabilization system protein ParE|nr:type II toxin-antitoxin system RelE/ParE family toxin [Halieaceae bacterium]
MKYAVRLREEADQDLRDAAEWYEKQRAGLGAQFLDQVLKTVNTIGDQPESFPVVYRGLRRALLARFPFAVFYRVLDQEAVVFSIMHASRDPENWKTRY